MWSPIMCVCVWSHYVHNKRISCMYWSILYQDMGNYKLGTKLNGRQN